jgi:luciferase family oxidoreductase group 1
MNEEAPGRHPTRMALPLSVLDLVPLGTGGTSTQSIHASTELARAVDRLGFTRLWWAEHHNMPGIATTTPELLIAHIGRATSRIRLGAGGVMLPNHSPLKVAESYRLLHAMYPDRVDLGIGRAPGTDQLTALALRRSRQALRVDDFVEQLAELRGYCDGTMPEDHPFAVIKAMPDDVALPPIWLLGSSDFSANLAAALGLGFAFAGHFSDEPPEGPMRAYRAGFRPGALAAPHAILALAVYCADTDHAAERMASSVLRSFIDLRSGQPRRLPSPDEVAARGFSPVEQAAVAGYRRRQITGTPGAVRARLEQAARLTGADEVMPTRGIQPRGSARSSSSPRRSA